MRSSGNEFLKIKELLKSHTGGMSITEIAGALGKNKHSVGRYLDILHASGYIDLRTYGMAKVYTLSSKVPLTALLSYTSDIVIVLDRDRRVVQANKPFFTLVNLPSDKVLNLVINQIESPVEKMQTFLSEIHDTLGNSKTTEEHINLSLSGKIPRFFRMKVILTDLEDGTKGTTLILEDITAEYNAQKAVNESETFFRNVLSEMTDGLIVMEGSEYLYVNNRFTRITGYSINDLKEISLLSLPLSQEREWILKTINETKFENGISKELRFWAKPKYGSEIYLYVRVSEVPYSGRTRRYIFFTDMTKWKREEELKDLQHTIFDKLVELFPQPFYILDEDGYFILVNEAFEAFSKLKHSTTLYGKNVNEVLSKSLAPSLYNRDDLLKIPLNPDFSKELSEISFEDGTKKSAIISRSIVLAGIDSRRYIFSVIFGADESIQRI